MRILSTYIFSVPEMFLQIKLSRDYSECQGLAIMVIIGLPVRISRTVVYRSDNP